MKFLKTLLQKLRELDVKRGYTCDCCGKELFTYPADRFCADCLSALSYNDGNTCDKCGRKTVTKGVCLNCKRILPSFTKGFSPLVYRNKSASVVNRLKNGEFRLALFLGELSANTFLRNYTGEDKELLLVPVPLTKDKEKTRGYNQAQLLCESVARILRENGFTAIQNNDVLIKKKETAQQKHLHYKERFENAKNAYRVTDKKVCKGKTILLVDDILTTGATSGECARKLQSAGAKRIFFVSVASLPEKRESIYKK